MGAKVVLFIESAKLFDGKLFFAYSQVLGYDGCYTTGADPMCRRTPPEAKTAQVVDATLCARNSRETLKHPAPLTPPTPSLGVAGARGEGKKGHITTII